MWEREWTRYLFHFHFPPSPSVLLLHLLLPQTPSKLWGFRRLWARVRRQAPPSSVVSPLPPPPIEEAEPVSLWRAPQSEGSTAGVRCHQSPVAAAVHLDRRLPPAPPSFNRRIPTEGITDSDFLGFLIFGGIWLNWIWGFDCIGPIQFRWLNEIDEFGLNLDLELFGRVIDFLFDMVRWGFVLVCATDWGSELECFIELVSISAAHSCYCFLG